MTRPSRVLPAPPNASIPDPGATPPAAPPPPGPAAPAAAAGSGAALVHEIFAATAAARPRAVAVEFGAERVTYAALAARAHRLARHLRARGVERGARVGLLLRRSPDAYAALLAILEAGAAYVPLDPECPPERIAFILADSGARALVTASGFRARHAGYGGAVVRVDADAGAIAAAEAAPLAPAEVGVAPADLCYVLYTSGSTGRPKGVLVEHRNVAALIEAEAALFGVEARDRVYQGFTLAFDASVEEVWLAFRAGATLVAATPAMERAGPDLARLLAAAQVSVLSCVPTLLAMLETDVPTLRLLILGGEACPGHLVARWARPGRRVVNTYGPTEATVIATSGDLRPGRRVTIGRPIPGTRVHLLDAALRPVPPGEVGEICIGGAGVARGYAHLAGEEQTRFVPEPWALGGRNGDRLYRTGDLGRETAEGELEFLGRADAQVKLRGFRIELAEVESALLRCDGVRSAACALREDAPGLARLLAYVVPRNGSVDEARIKEQLRRRLPGYMIPARIEPIAELPRLPSGKLDRAALPEPARGRARARPGGGAGTPTERAIARVWESLFAPQPVARDDDFFLDLGGHSLLAARAVSQLRRDARFAALAMSDVYAHPSIATLAAALDARAVAAGSGAQGTGARAPAGAAPADGRGARAAVTGAGAAAAPRAGAVRHALAGAFQAASLYPVFALRALEWVTPYLVFWLLLARGARLPAALGWAVAAAVATLPCMAAVGIAAKWVLLGRVRPGRHPLWGAYHLRWWLAHSLIEAVPLDGLAGTPLLPCVCRLLGVRVGRDVYLGTHAIAAFDLVSIGDGASVDDGASLLGCAVENGELSVGPIAIGRDGFVGARAVLREHTALADGARLEDLSLLPAGGRVPAGETWAGSPARPAAAVAAPPRPRPQGAARRAATLALYAALALLLPLVPLIAFVPGIALLLRADLLAHPGAYLAWTPVVGASFVLLMGLEVVLLKWLLVGRVRAGNHPLHGGFYVRHWVVDRLMAMSLDVVAPIHATLYALPWYRALGARLGRLVELSTASTTPPDLLAIEDGGTIADEASIGEARIERGWMTLAPAHVGRRAFVGNSGMLPTGVRLGDGALVGVLSVAPTEPGAAERPGGAWLGSPPLALPRRQPSPGFREDRTYDPPRPLWLARGAFELLRVTLPPAGFILVTAAVVAVTVRLWDRLGPGPALALAPLVYAAGCGGVLLAVALAKWTIVGRYRPFVHPLWSPFVWRLELVNALYEFLATPLALEPLRGTPLLPAYLRLLGARIGRRTLLETTGFLEWDLVEIGDRATLNEDCVAQTHLFEDRVLKASRLRIGADCTVGAYAIVLYDSTMEEGSCLDALSLLMKGETLPEGSAWVGSPPVPAGLAHAAPPASAA